MLQCGFVRSNFSLAMVRLTFHPKCFAQSTARRLERVMGIEPTCPAWKAGALPLSYTRQSTPPNSHSWDRPPCPDYMSSSSFGRDGGGGWIRTNVGLRQRVYSPSPLATRAPLLQSFRIKPTEHVSEAPKYENLQRLVNVKNTQKSLLREPNVMHR
jgi:hypothetical protein